MNALLSGQTEKAYFEDAARATRCDLAILGAAFVKVMIPHTIKDLIARAGVEFERRGEHAIENPYEEWRLFVVAHDASV